MNIRITVYSLFFIIFHLSHAKQGDSAIIPVDFLTPRLKHGHKSSHQLQLTYYKLKQVVCQAMNDNVYFKFIIFFAISSAELIYALGEYASASS